MERICTRIHAVLVFAVLSLFNPASGAEVADFYKTNAVKIIVGFGPGGGVDAYSRILARHMGGNIPGSPNIIVSNMPGAGSMRAVQSLETLPKDGTVIVAFNPGAITFSLIDPEQVNFRFNDVGYLGSISAETQVCYMWQTTGIKTFDGFLKRPSINMGATSKTDSEYMLGALLRNLFGANIHHVAGYTSKPDINLAIERGELDGGCGSFDGVPKDWVAGNKLNMILRLTQASPPGTPEMPYIMDLASAEQRQVMEAILGINDIFRPYIVAKGIPEDRLKVLRDAFFVTVNSAPFLAEAAKANRTVQNPLPGEEVARIVEEMLKKSPAIIEKMKEAVR